MIDKVKSTGTITRIIERIDGSKEIMSFSNAVVNTGNQALAASLSNQLGGSSYNFYVSNMLFGSNGTTDGIPLLVNTSMNGLFGPTIANKPVISMVDPNIPSDAIFTSVLTFNDVNGQVVNELALQMATGDIYSMATFPDLNKTSLMQITWVWRVSFV